MKGTGASMHPFFSPMWPSILFLLCCSSVTEFQSKELLQIWNSCIGWQWPSYFLSVQRPTKLPTLRVTQKCRVGEEHQRERLFLQLRISLVPSCTKILIKTFHRIYVPHCLYPITYRRAFWFQCLGQHI